LITYACLSKPCKKQGRGLFQSLYRIILLLFFLNSSVRIFGQNHFSFHETAQSEEIEFSYALGLYRDSLFQLAEEQFEDFIKKYPSSINDQQAAFLQAECLYATSQLQRSASRYMDFIHDYPNSPFEPEALLKLGQVYLRLKKYTEAVTVFKSFLEKYGDHGKAGEAAYWIGEAYQNSDDPQNALKYYTLAQENYPQHRFRPSALYSIAGTYQKRKEYLKAVEMYNKFIAEFPQSPLTPMARVRVGECLFFAKEYHRALDSLIAIRNTFRDEEEMGKVDYLIAEAFYRLGDYPNAQKRYEQFREDHPRHSLVPEVTYMLGWISFEQKNYPEAIETFNMLVERSDELGRAALYRRSVMERLTGKDNEAVFTLKELLNREPEGEWSDQALFDLGMIFFEEKKIREAHVCFQQLAADFQQSDVLPEACMMTAECLFLERDFAGAELWYEKSRVFPNLSFEEKVTASFKSALCSFRQKKFNEAFEKWEAFVEQFPGHPQVTDAKYFQAESEYLLGDYEIASQLYQESAADPHSTKREKALYGAARSFFQQGKYQEAIEAFERIVVSFPKGKYSFNARVQIGEAYFLLKEYKKAVGSYQAVLRMYPDSSSVDYASYRLGISYFHDGKNTEAFKAFEALRNLLPHSSLASEAQFALGWINFHQKEYGEALKEFQKVINDFPTSDRRADAYYFLGNCYFVQRHYTAAEKSYREVLQLFPRSTYSAEASQGVQRCLLGEQSEDEAVKDSIGRDEDIASAKEQFRRTSSPVIPFFIDGVPMNSHDPGSIIGDERKISDEEYDPLTYSPDKASMGLPLNHEPTMKNDWNDHRISDDQRMIHSGFAETGIGTYFTPHMTVGFGQVLPEFSYTLNGIYHLSKGFAPNTDRSDGRLSARGETSLASNAPLLKNTSLDGLFEYQSKSFHFYGSQVPEFTRTVSGVTAEAAIQNQLRKVLPYTAGISMTTLNISDSNALTKERCIDFHGQTAPAISSLPIQTNLRLLSASGGLGFMDLSGGIENYFSAGISLKGSLHLYWANGMAGQHIASLRPHILASYQMNSTHRIYAAFEPQVIPQTLALNMVGNQYLSASSAVHHTDVTNSGDLGLESGWSSQVRSRLSFSVKSIKDLPLFSDLTRQGVWTTVYSGQTTIVIFYAEMFAKLTSNDYFASSILLRSARDSYSGRQIPYTPAVEVECKGSHNFGSTVVANVRVKVVGEREADLTGDGILPGYAVFDVDGEYAVLQSLKISARIKNIFNANYELWRGYQEFPLMIETAVQIFW